ncbi:DUF3426 domain-containing protein [Desulfococcus multivorans]|uniref:DUF3426 domain-containing protein n=1 Tax=Desulfococcus multivorans TaxID=897 RepID=UPI00099B0340|nr:DUF3426 domain-containing protein [Desulfococcus multivorans]SKA04948.1 Protein of unknown function [Desulfococcus multivorans DSM 2059]
MIITCDYCDAQFDPDHYPEQLVDSKIRCIRCNAVLEVPGPLIEQHSEKSPTARSATRNPDISEKEARSSRTNMPGKKQKKKKMSRSPELGRPDPGANDRLLSGKGSGVVIGGLPGTEDGSGLSLGGEARPKADGMTDEKTEMFSLDDLDDTDVRNGADAEKELLFDFDLEHMGIDADTALPFELDDRIDAVDRDGLLDLFMDVDLMKTIDKGSGRRLSEDDELHLDIDDEDLDADEDGLGRPAMDFRNLEKALQDAADDIEEDASFDDTGLGLDENLLLDLDLDFDDEEHDPATVMVDDGEAMRKPDDISEEESEDVGLGLDENLLLDLDLDLDFDDEEPGPAAVPADGEEDDPAVDPVLDTDLSNKGLDPDEQLILDLDFDEAGTGNFPASSVLSGTTSDPIELTVDMNDDHDRSSTDIASDDAGDFSLELDLDLADEDSPLSGQDEGSFTEGPVAADILVDEEEDVPVELTLESADANDRTPGSEENVPEGDLSATDIAVDDEADFSLELDLDLADEASPLSGQDEDSFTEGPVAADTLVDEEEDVPVELTLESADADDRIPGSDENVPAGDPAATDIALDEEGEFSLELDFEEADNASADNASMDQAPAESVLPSVKDEDDILEVLGGDLEFNEEFLFNMDPEKFKEAPDALATTTNPANHENGDVDIAFDLKTPSSTFEDTLRHSDVPEAKHPSPAVGARIDEAVDRDDDFIDAFDMGIPTDEFEELKEKRSDRNATEKTAIDHNGFAVADDDGLMGRPRKRMPVLILLSMLLGALLFGAYSFGLFKSDNAKNILYNIPLLKDYLPAPNDRAGEIVTLAHTIQERFVENQWVGTLFVVSGSVQNGYAMPRSHIQVTGRLFSSGKEPAGVETVYCGNTLTDAELNSLPPNELKARLGNKAGAQNSNIDVPSGEILPYMIVFDNLPETLEEFTIAVKESVPADG